MGPFPRPTLAAVALLLLALAVAGCTSPPPAPPAAPAGVDRSVAGLPAASPSEEVRLANGSTYRLTAAPVAHDPGSGAPIRMFAYNGQIPGPTLRVAQGARVAVDFENALPFATTVHWHGLRLDVRNDGVQGLSQAPVPPGGAFRYDVVFPDEGAFWYHPHVREDLQQDLGLAGLILVDGPRNASEAWPREETLVLDDLLVEGRDVAAYGPEAANRALMGRFGNLLLVDGKASWQATAAPGERVRLHLLDAANVRSFQLTFPGAKAVQLIGADGGFLAAPRNHTALGQFLLSPGERLAVDVVMPDDGAVRIVHKTPGAERELGRLVVAGAPVATMPAPPGPHDRARASLEPALQQRAQPVEVTWELDVALSPDLERQVAGSPHAVHGGGGAPRRTAARIEWEEVGPELNAASTSRDVRWIIRDAATGEENMDINRTFVQGSLVNVRIRNLADSAHPMQHPIHLHGQRFVVASANGLPNPSPAWKDTVLVPTGEEVVITVEMSNPGTWAFHCHISEHLEAGMMGTFTVR